MIRSNSSHQFDRLAVVWAPHESRTEMFGDLLGARVLHIHYLKYKRPLYAPFKYLLQSVTTIQRLIRAKPKVVYVTNPPAFAGLVVALYCAFTRCEFVMDTHSPALFHPKLAWTVPLQRLVARRALVNIVDQDQFRLKFESWNARALVLERPPDPSSAPTPLPPDCGTVRVVVVNTFARDEPLEPILLAAARDSRLHIKILGDTSLVSSRVVANAPSNVVFTGYLRGDDYWAALREARIVVALTTFPYSLLAGCQDAMVVGRPLVTSDQPVLRSFFGDAAVYVENDAASLLAGLAEANSRASELAVLIARHRDEREQHWAAVCAQLERLISDHEARCS